MDLVQILQAGLLAYISQTILILLLESAELLNTCQELQCRTVFFLPSL